MNRVRSFFVLLTVGAVAFASGVAPFGYAIAQAAQTSSAIAATTSSNPNAAVAATVQSYFADIPVMIAIAACESGPRQFAANGGTLYSGTDNVMVGVFQIDETIHYAPAMALGFDIDTLAGNLGYARYLYGAEGTDPWISSFGCWGASSTQNAQSSVGQASPASSSSAPIPALTLNLSLGDIDPQVLVLQQLLNQTGFTLTTSGPGSPGNETTKFGSLTYAALKKFQCTENIICYGDEASTGYGLLNAPTRATLLAMTASPAASSSASFSVGISTATSSATSTGISAPTSTTTPMPAAIATTTSVSLANIAAENASLESRIAALIVIVNQLEAELSAKI